MPNLMGWNVLIIFFQMKRMHKEQVTPLQFIWKTTAGSCMWLYRLTMIPVPLSKSRAVANTSFLFHLVDFSVWICSLKFGFCLPLVFSSITFSSLSILAFIAACYLTMKYLNSSNSYCNSFLQFPILCLSLVDFETHMSHSISASSICSRRWFI
jgi:hypothetical protein